MTTPQFTHRVVILQRRLVQYRVPLFEQLRKACAEKGIELRVAYGEASKTDQARRDSASLDWGDHLQARWISVGNHELLWQSVPKPLRSADLLILTQENKILSNYRFLLTNRFNKSKLAYWGHGKNRQALNADSYSERFKSHISTRIDWWFAYTLSTVELMKSRGFPAERITNLENAIDDKSFRRDLDSVTPELLTKCRQMIGLEDSQPLALYCGSLYKEKRIDWLLKAGDSIQEKIPGFKMVIIGEGPCRQELEDMADQRSWAYYVGKQTGIDKAAWFSLATLQLSPGAVGLHILDSFIAGVPLVTTKGALHGPEIDYMNSGENGLITEDSLDDYGAAIIELLEQPSALKQMVDAGVKKSKSLTLDNMVDNFVGGIQKALQVEPLR